jgi:hypothetical protein
VNTDLGMSGIPVPDAAGYYVPFSSGVGGRSDQNVVINRLSGHCKHSKQLGCRENAEIAEVTQILRSGIAVVFAASLRQLIQENWASTQQTAPALVVVFG